MKYYSDELKKFFPTEEECLDAEVQYEAKLKEKKEAEEKRSAERKNRAKEVEAAYNEALKAAKKYRELVTNFCKDFGSFHMTYTQTDPVESLSDFVGFLVDLF